LPHSNVTARFDDLAAAHAAGRALANAGIGAEFIAITGGSHEGRLLGRVLLLIVLWSIPGGALGASLGLLLALAGVGPAGTTGAVVQVVSWLIIGHLLAGMWAGYLLLSDRSRREMYPGEGGQYQVTVRCRSAAEAETAARVLAGTGE
jgi:hypothetical protein